MASASIMTDLIKGKEENDVKEIVDYKVLTDDVKYSVSGIWNDDKYVKVHGDQVPGR